MSTAVSLGLLLAGVLAVLLWLLGGPRSNPGPDGGRDAETSEAEDEVRGVDAFTAPADAEEELPDWGPGAPRS